MKLCVIGLGYIGLPTAAVFANEGFEVVGVDKNQEIANTLNQGQIHIEEPGLGELVEKVVKNGAFRASTIAEDADVFIVAVPTPNNDDEFKSCDLTYVMNATEQVLEYVIKGNTIIIESTIAPRTMDDYIVPLVESKGFIVGEDIFLVHCPERVLPGKIIFELENNNRIIGGITKACSDKGAMIYQTFVKGEIIKTDAKTAEMSKLMENTYRDVNIALSNELTKICNKLEIDVLDVISMANKHPRVNLHSPGPGVGGHCLAVDPYFIVSKAPDDAKIIRNSREVNNSMKEYVYNKIKELTNENSDPVIGILGITYKGNVDDIRESPAIDIIEMLNKDKYTLLIHDPFVKDNPSINLTTQENVLKNSDLIVVLSDHNEFKNISFENILTTSGENVKIFDTKNIIKNYPTINFGNLFNYVVKESNLIKN